MAENLRITGVLRTWNDDRGFGFIAPTHGGPELFVHISAFPRDGTRPTVGERLTYELGRGSNGKPQAVRVIRTALGDKAATLNSRTKRVPERSSWLAPLVVVALVVAAGSYGFSRYKAYEHSAAPESAIALPVTAPVESSTNESRRCDGRTMCSQMTSCAEAKWFLKNCPDTRMDGNHDGTPCEQQWCTSPFAK